MKRNANYRILQRKKKEKKIINIIKNIWMEKLEGNENWYKVMVDTPKRCNGSCCKNPRKSGLSSGKECLTIGELKDKEDVKNQLKNI